jgi:DNA-binding NarL/FixJ family response regulator
MKPHILIVNNQQMMAEALIALLKDKAEFTLAGISEARQYLQQENFSYAIVDIDPVAGEQGLSLLAPLLLARVKPIVMAASANVGQIRAAIRLGAYGFIDKLQPSSHLQRVLHEVQEHQLSFPDGMIDELRQDEKLMLPKMGKSEKRLLDYFYSHAEETNAQIGNGLALSEGRIRNCMTTLMRKFDVRSRGHLIKEVQLRGYFPGCLRAGIMH